VVSHARRRTSESRDRTLIMGRFIGADISADVGIIDLKSRRMLNEKKECA
jgi:hypothetical protein